MKGMSHRRTTTRDRRVILTRGSRIVTLFAILLMLCIQPARPEFIAVDIDGDETRESLAGLNVVSEFPVRIVNLIGNRNTNESFGFDFEWLTAGPGGWSSSLPAATDQGTWGLWAWETYQQVYSLTCDSNNPDLPCLMLQPDPDDGGGERTFAGIPGRTLIPSSITVSDGALTTNLVIFFSPPRTLLEITSSVRQQPDGTFAYETRAENLTEAAMAVEVTPGPLGCEGCANLLEDENNCGGCGIVCGEGECCQLEEGGPVCVPSEGPCSVCGNGILEDGEECDGGDFGEESCEGFEFCGGSLACDALCNIDVSGCEECQVECPLGESLCGEICCDDQSCCPGSEGDDICCGADEFCTEGPACIPIVAISSAILDPAQIGDGCPAGLTPCSAACEFPQDEPEGILSPNFLTVQVGSLSGFPSTRLALPQTLDPGDSMVIDARTSNFPAREISSQFLVCGDAIPGGSVECSGGVPGTIGMVSVLVPDDTKPIGDTFLAPYAMEIRDPSGNGAAEAGETIQLLLSIVNAGLVGVSEVSASLSAPGVDVDGDGVDDPIAVTQPDSGYPDIAGFAGAPAPSTNEMPFLIEIPAGHPIDTARLLTLEVSGQTMEPTPAPFNATVNFTLAVGGGCVAGTDAIGEFDTVQGLLSPLEQLVPEGNTTPMPKKAFKAGRALPLRLRLGCDGSPVSDALAAPPRIVRIERSGTPIGDLPTLDLDAGAANDTGTEFRYDAESGTWIFNLKTSDLGPGSYIVTIAMPNGRLYTAAFILK